MSSSAETLALRGRQSPLHGSHPFILPVFRHLLTVVSFLSAVTTRVYRGAQITVYRGLHKVFKAEELSYQLMGLLARFLDHLVRLSGRVSLAQLDRIIRIRSALFALLVPIRPLAHRLVRHVLLASL